VPGRDTEQLTATGPEQASAGRQVSRQTTAGPQVSSRTLALIVGAVQGGASNSAIARAVSAGRVQRPTLQRALKVSGDSDELIAWAKQFAGLDLRVEAGRLKIAGSLTTAKSPAMRRMLEEVIGSDTVAELDLRDHPNVVVGGFPEGGEKAQKIDPGHITTIEHHAPGHGIAKLMHEIMENFHGHRHAPREASPTERYEHAHEHGGITAESAVIKELRPGSGGRVADRATAEVVKDGAKVQYLINDFEDHFLTYRVTNPRLGAKMHIGDVRTLPAKELARITVANASDGADASNVAKLLQAHPTATALVRGPRAADFKKRVLQITGKALFAALAVSDGDDKTLTVTIREPSPAPDPATDLPESKSQTTPAAPASTWDDDDVFSMLTVPAPPAIK
jgi:hypothetical protein